MENNKQSKSYSALNETYSPQKKVQNSFSPYQETSQLDDSSSITDSQLDSMISDLDSEN